MIKSGTIYYVHTDQIGTPRVITNTSNTIVWKWDNTDPFGKNLPSVTTLTYNKRFAGQYFDNETNLHYNYYRTYNPLLGRYLQPDPIGLAGGFNLYNYVGSNPLGMTDPTGEFGVAGAFIGGAMDIGLQLTLNGGNINCINWRDVGLSVVAGSLGSGLLNGIGKIKNTGRMINGLKEVSNKWKPTREWLQKTSLGPLDGLKRIGDSQYHHWLIEQNSKIGKMIPEKYKNQPWNLNPLSKDMHMRLHGNVATGKLNVIEKWWYGTPGWAKGVEAGMAGAIAGDDCGC